MPATLAVATTLALCTERAAASPEVESSAPPAPLLLPELAPADRFQASLAVTASLGLATTLELASTVALGDFELAASAPFTAYVGMCLDGCPPGKPSLAALGNLKLGSRYVRKVGPFAISPSVWAWLPTQTASDRWWPRARAVMHGLDDSRAFMPGFALGVAIDGAWRTDVAFVQAELGVAVVADDGPQIDNVFGALGVGKQVSRATSLLAEWRVDAYPRMSAFHAVGVGLGRRDGQRRRWRLRAHAGASGASSEAGFAVGFDLVQRFE